MSGKIHEPMRDAFRNPMEVPVASRRGGWLTTVTGVRFYPLDPRPEEVVPFDIAHGLSQICRFAGQCREFYSVAQHSVLVSLEVGRRAGEPGAWDGQGISWRVLALYGLLHDAAEAYTSDIPKPVKQGLPEFKPIERRLMAAVHEHFFLRPHNGEIEAEVKRADVRLLATEMRDLTMVDVATDPRLSAIDPLPDPIDPWPIGKALLEFTARLRYLQSVDLSGSRGG